MKKYIVSCPPITREDIIAAAFDSREFYLETREGLRFVFMAGSFRVFHDKVSYVYRMNGKTLQEGSRPGVEPSDCSLLIKESGSGELDIPKPETNTIEQLMAMSNSQLQKIITDSRKFGIVTNRDLQKKMAELPMHEALVLEARATCKMSEIPMFTELDFSFFSATRKRNLHRV
ncbi:MAG: hypothetical protein RLY66_187 [Candidatus Parcubacteria bacterium]|jgi:hypothetical protein